MKREAESTKKISKAINVVLWIIQGLLAATLIWAGVMKVCQPVEKLAEMWSWTADNPELVKITGVIDLLGGLGLVLPSLLRMPRLTVMAAYGIVALMIAAIIFHISRGEADQTGFNIVVAVLALFIAIRRR